MVLSLPTRALLLAVTTTLCSAAVTLALDCNYFTASPAYCDPSVCNTGGGHGLYLFGDLNGDSQFIFTSEEGLITAGASLLSFQGTLIPRDLTHTQNSYQVELMFEHTMGMGMSQLMDPSAANMSSWEYYRLVSGFMRSTNANGPTYQIQQQMDNMPMQVGYGANSKNLGFGASIWINVVVGNTHIAGDFDMDLNCTSHSSSSSSSEDCPVAPFFSVNHDDSIYVCYTSSPGVLDANIMFADGFTFNWHPSPVFATADNCYLITLPKGHGHIIWVQVHDFNCHYGESNLGREQNCGVNLCYPSTGSSSSSDSSASTSASSSSDSSSSGASSSSDSSSSSVGSSSSSTESSSSESSSSVASSSSSQDSSSSPSSSQESSSNAPTPGSSSSSQESSSNAASSSSQDQSSSSPSSSSQESASSSNAPSSSSSSSQESSSSAPTPGSSSSSQDSSNTAPTCSDSCPAAPFFSVNNTEIFACFTTLPDTDMDANIRYEDGTIFNWHPYNYVLDSNNCIQFFVPNDNQHGAIVWAQVNGFNCHYGENNSGREQNCGWNLCQACGDKAPVTSGLPSGVSPYNPIDNQQDQVGGETGTTHSGASTLSVSTLLACVIATALLCVL